MRRAEYYALGVLAGLLVIAAALLACATYYGTSSFWAGGLVALAQALLVVIAFYGMRLGRQRAELDEIDQPITTRDPSDGLSSLGGFRMSMADETGRAISAEPLTQRPARRAEDVRTLESGFQRMVIGMVAAGQLGVAAIIAVIVYSNIASTAPGKTIAVTRVPIDPMAIIVALGALSLYVIMQWVTRPSATQDERTDSINGMLIMALPGSAAVAVAVILARFQVGWAGEVAALIVVASLVLQAAELIVNALKSYAGIEEFDQDPTDLQRTPLTPMLTSMSIEGVRILLTQTLGLQERRGESTVMGRMLPRVLVALVILAVFISCFRSVPVGEVAIRERLGLASNYDIDHPLQAGLHFTAPWPIDRLVTIPTMALHEVTVGTEEPVAEVNGKPLDFRFWTVRHTANNEAETNFITGDMSTDGQPAPQLLGTFVSVWWHVKDPSDFYRHLSHSNFVKDTSVKPIYEAMINVMASQAITRAFAHHRMDEIIGPERHAVEVHCRAMLQQDLDSIGSGIQIADLSIKDVHPPIGIGIRPSPTSPLGVEMGPANAYEFVVQSREYKEQVIDKAEADAINKTSQATGEAARIVSDANVYASGKVSQATSDTAQWTQSAKAYGRNPRLAQDWKLYQMLDQQLPGVNKIILGHGVEPPDIYQRTKDEPIQMRPSMQQ